MKAPQAMSTATKKRRKALEAVFVKSEPLTYGLENPHNSFFLDMVRARRNNDVEARARLERHGREDGRRDAR